MHINEAKERVTEYMERRYRHHNHKEGDVLYYHCEYIKAMRKGIVKVVVPHDSMNCYVLEVETGCPLGASFLVLKSEFQVKTEDEL